MDMQDKTTVRPPVRQVAERVASDEAREERAKSHRRLAIAFALLMVLLGGTAAFVTYGLEFWGGHSVPNVLNEGVARATSDLEGAGFVVTVEEHVVDEGVGLVYEQAPKAGQRCEEGTTVTIYVGIARTVPAVVGLPLEEARQALTDAGATDIQVVNRPSSESLGNVLEVSPHEGASFSSHDAITLVVASALEMPDVMGADEDDAIRQLEALGLDVQVTYVESDEDGHTVVASSPAAGASIAEGDHVELSVSAPYPSSVRAFAEYFECRPADVSAFLAKEGFRCKGGYIDGRGNANVLYSDGSANIRLCSNPFDHLFDPNGTTPELLSSEASGINSSMGATGNQGDVVAEGTDFRGVRYEYGSIPVAARSVGMEGVRAIMEECDLGGYAGSCTEASLIMPRGQEGVPARDGRRFVCAYGSEGGYTWTVLLAQTEKDGSDVRAVVTYAPTDIYGNYDLTRNGNRICDFVAFVDMYITGVIVEVPEHTDGEGDQAGEQAQNQDGGQSQGAGDGAH